MKALYLCLNLFSIFFPLIRSWDSRLSYHRKWYALIPAIVIIGSFFITWDVYFTQAKIWGFDAKYLIGMDILGLPIEEWMFFVCIPFACFFIYEATIFYIKTRPLRKWATPIFVCLSTILLVVGMLNLDRSYTSLTCILTSSLLILHVFIIKRDYRDRFILGYIFSVIPFFLVNGILTGTFIQDQIVWYDNAENLGIRIGTIPIEDSIYLLLYLLSMTMIYEAILKRWPLVGIDND